MQSWLTSDIWRPQVAQLIPKTFQKYPDPFSLDADEVQVQKQTFQLGSRIRLEIESALLEQGHPKQKRVRGRYIEHRAAVDRAWNYSTTWKSWVAIDMHWENACLLRCCNLESARSQSKVESGLEENGRVWCKMRPQTTLNIGSRQSHFELWRTRKKASTIFYADRENFTSKWD